MAESEGRQTILVVDDSFTNRVLLGKIFSEDFRVELAENGVIALQKLRELRDVAAVVLDIEMPELDGFGVLEAMRQDPALREIPVVVDTIVDDAESQIRALDCGAVDILLKPFSAKIVLHRVRNILARQEAARQTARAQNLEELLRQSEIDSKTGLLTRQGFCRKAAELMQRNPDQKFVILRWDVDHFKVFNDMYGISAGDEFLARVGEIARSYLDDGIIYGRWNSDHFVVCVSKKRFIEHGIAQQITDYRIHGDFHFVFFIRLGVYEVEDRSIAVELMCDRALLALKSIKGSYGTRIAWYSDAMRAAMLEEGEILGEMEKALTSEQFQVYLQPQYNYATGRLIGAEALVRWKHPQRGLIPPNKFIPVFESCGFISRLDEFVCEQTCRLLRRWLDSGLQPPPVSINVSRKDIYTPHLADKIEQSVKKQSLPVAMLRLEITESAYMENAEQLIRVVSDLRNRGFAVEMDDFGSGYSSLNTLKAVPVDKLKLDIKFLERGSSDDTRGGNILSSIVRMAHWLRLPVIAEGVETHEQAEYLKSIGCLHMQGYLFARPMPAAEFEKLLQKTPANALEGEMYCDNIQNAADFLSDSTQATLLFNSFVGGAGIVEFDGERVEALRLNDKFFEELHVSREDFKPCLTNILASFDQKNRDLYLAAVNEAISTGKESFCDVRSLPFHEDSSELWTRTRLRLLAKNENRYILYLSVEDISERVGLSQRLVDILNNVPCGIINYKIESDQLEISYHNDRTATMFGFSSAEFDQRFGNDPLAAIHEDDRLRVKESMQDTLRRGLESLEITYRHICAAGGFKWVRNSAHVLRRQGKKIYVSAIIQDVDAEFRAKWVTAERSKKLEGFSPFLRTLFSSRREEK